MYQAKPKPQSMIPQTFHVFSVQIIYQNDQTIGHNVVGPPAYAWDICLTRHLSSSPGKNIPSVFLSVQTVHELSVETLSSFLRDFNKGIVTEVNVVGFATYYLDRDGHDQCSRLTIGKWITNIYALPEFPHMQAMEWPISEAVQKKTVISSNDGQKRALELQPNQTHDHASYVRKVIRSPTQRTNTTIRTQSLHCDQLIPHNESQATRHEIPSLVRKNECLSEAISPGLPPQIGPSSTDRFCEDFAGLQAIFPATFTNTSNLNENSSNLPSQINPFDVSQPSSNVRKKSQATKRRYNSPDGERVAETKGRQRMKRTKTNNQQ